MDISGLQSFRLDEKNGKGQLVFHSNGKVFYVERGERVEIESSLTIDTKRSKMRLDGETIKTVLSEDMKKIIQFIETNEIFKYVKIIKESLEEENVAESLFQSKDACSFFDKENSFISFRVDQKDCLRMICDDEKIGDPIVGVQRIMIDETKGQIFDGAEIVPVLKKDRKRVFAWFRNIKDLHIEQ